MNSLASRILATLAGGLLALTSSAVATQHCGGPCEIPRPAHDPITTNARFHVIPGKETANWRYLDNFHWAVDGEPQHSVEKTLETPSFQFALRSILVSPAGNGFLVTGRPYHHKARCNTKWLMHFCAPDGAVLRSVSIEDALLENERVPGPCPNCSHCTEVLYELDQDPAVSSNGAYAEVVAPVTKRRLSFFLPLGALIADRDAFDLRLAKLDLARLTAPARNQELERCRSLVAAVDPAATSLTAAHKELLAAGFRALPALAERIAAEEEPGAKQTLVTLRNRLRPWNDVGYEEMAIDLGLLLALADGSKTEVADAAMERLVRLVPAAVSETEPAQWIASARDRLRWDAATSSYVLRDR